MQTLIAPTLVVSEGEGTAYIEAGNDVDGEKISSLIEHAWEIFGVQFDLLDEDLFEEIEGGYRVYGFFGEDLI